MNYEHKGRDLSGQATQMLAALAAIVPMIALTIWMYVIRDNAPGISEFFLGPLLVGGGMIFWLSLLHVVVCRDKVDSLGFHRGGFARDIFIGSAMGLAFLLLKFIEQPVLNELFAPRPPSHEIILFASRRQLRPYVVGALAGTCRLARRCRIRGALASICSTPVLEPGFRAGGKVGRAVGRVRADRACARLPGTGRHHVDWREISDHGLVFQVCGPNRAVDRCPRGL